jgi:hypothetical protein
MISCPSSSGISVLTTALTVVVCACAAVTGQKRDNKRTVARM